MPKKQIGSWMLLIKFIDPEYPAAESKSTPQNANWLDPHPISYWFFIKEETQMAANTGWILLSPKP